MSNSQSCLYFAFPKFYIVQCNIAKNIKKKQQTMHLRMSQATKYYLNNKYICGCVVRDLNCIFVPVLEKATKRGQRPESNRIFSYKFCNF